MDGPSIDLPSNMSTQTKQEPSTSTQRTSR